MQLRFIGILLKILSLHRAYLCPYPWLMKVREKRKCALVFKKGDLEKLHRKYESAHKIANPGGVKGESSRVWKFFLALGGLIRW